MGDAYDVAVLGAGPAGALTAGLLAQRGLRILLLEWAAGFGFKVGETLPAEAGRLLSRAGVLERFRRVPSLPCAGNLSAWGSDLARFRPAIANPLGGGWRLDRSAFDQMLRDGAAAAGAAVRYGARVVGERRAGRSWSIRLAGEDGGDELTCRWVVDATGRRAAFARRRGAARVASDRLVGLAVAARVDGDVDRTTLVESAEQGWWYSGLVPGGTRVTAYFTDGDQVGPAAARAQAWLGLAARTKLIAPLAARFPGPGVLATSALLSDTSRLDACAGDGWVAVGDAAAALDPLSSFGLTHAIGSAIRVAGLFGDGGEVDRAAVREYADRVALEHDRRDAERVRYYEMERRWTTSTFWRRRQHYPAGVAGPSSKAVSL